MDPLSAFLATARVDASLFSRAELSAPWGVSTRGFAEGSGVFHAFVAGGGQLEVDGEPVRRIEAGDVVVMPHGHAHVLRHDGDSPVQPIGDWPSEPGADGLPCLVGGGDGPAMSILCGSFRFDDEAREMLLPALPPVIHVHRGPTAAWLSGTLQQLAGELAADQPGSAVLVSRLMELLFVGVLRAWLDEAPDATGWLAALTDPQLARALGAIHGDAARPWTVAELARTAGMSRSAFFTRFNDRVGEPPAAYLTRWRMTVARSTLRRSNLPLIEVAERVGYSSEAAFSRAFKRAVGLPPSRWRRAVA